MENGFLKKEDYEEPCCPLKAPTNVTPIPVGRVIEKLDSYLDKRDYESAQRHLEYWLREAEAGADIGGKLTVLNELVGLLRKTGQKEYCLSMAEQAAQIACSDEFENTVSSATTLLNCATGFKAFSLTEKALEFYRIAREKYEKYLEPLDSRMAGLYNNMALALSELKQFDEAQQLFERAIEILSHNENSEADIAITYLNLADLVHSRDGEEKSEKAVGEYIEKAEKLLDSENLPHDGYHAFVCEKCAPVFGYYGYFLAERKFADRAKKIYES